MKKTSTRLAIIGGLILVSACAIALAQYDSRNRDREPLLAQTLTREPIEPIRVDGEWESSLPAHPIVRANNDKLTSYSGLGEAEPLGNERHSASENPLRDVTAPDPRLPSHENPRKLTAEFANYALPQLDTTALASGEVPVGPPAWLAGQATSNQSLPGTASTNPLPTSLPSSNTQPAPELPSGLPQANGLLPAASRQESQLPALPAPSATTQGFPDPQAAGSSATAMGGFNGTSSVVNPPSIPSLPSLTTPASSPPPTISNGSADMSDTQRGVMSPTDLSAPRANVPAYNNGDPRPSNSFISPPGNYPQSNPNLGYVAPSNSGPAAETPPSLPASETFGRSTTQGNSNSASNYAYGAQPTTSLVSNKPGNRFLDGSQSPVVEIQKRAPEEIQVGKKATFVITVRNAGNATAHEVQVRDSVPRGARLVEAAPMVTPSAEGMLLWSLGEIAAGDERTITLQIVPEVQGEIGSVATVSFAAQASVRTVATLSRIELLVETLPEVLIGDSHQLTVVVKNSGTGVARTVALEADIPAQFTHESGDRQLIANIGDMRPNDTRRITLDVTAVQPGQSGFVVRAVTDDGVQSEERGAVDVRAPQLTASIEGPKVRYLDRPATYRINVLNNGTAAATNLDFVVYLPSGLRFNSANNDGGYDQNSHSVHWGLYELPAGASAPIELTVLPVELGVQGISFSASGELGVKAEVKAEVRVDGLAELAFKIDQDNGTIETKSATVYTVQILNNGNKSDRDVSLAVELPPGSKLLDVMDAPVNYRMEGTKLVFAPVAEMKTNQQLAFRFRVQHDQPGTRITRATVTSSNWQVAMAKEIGTLVYDDQH